MKQKICCIYLIENLTNCKKYLGQTTNFHSRKINHKSASKTKNRPICLAIRKYGWENFEFTILIKDSSINHDKLDFWESYFIELFNTMNRKKGYNCESGGSLNKFHTKQTIKRMKIANTKVGQNLKAKTGNYKGVCWNKEKQKWESGLKRHNKDNFLGYYDTEIEGVKAYNDYAMYLNETFDDCNYLLNEIQDYISKPRNIPEETKIEILENKSSKYIGVTYVKSRQNYQSSIKFQNKSLNLCSGKTELEAAKVYNQMAAYLNKTYTTKYELNDIPNYITIPKDIHSENKKKYSNKKSSQYIGVTFSKQNNKWRALLAYDKKQIHIGTFIDELEAAKAYNKKAKKLNKELNKQVYKLNVFT